MKKMMLILAIAGVLVSCSSKDETIKKETTVKVVASQEEAVTPVETTEVEATEVVTVEVEEPTLTDEDYKSVSEPVKKVSKSKKQIKLAPKPVVEEKVEVTSLETPTMETSVDDVVDEDVDKQIAEVETETKAVEPEPIKEETSNKTLYGILGAILVAAAAVFVFKKK